MQESFSSLLCSETWHYDSDHANQIIFHENGTGKLTCRTELNVWIAAEFDWQPHDQHASGQPVDAAARHGTASRASPPAAAAKIDMTLTRRRIPRLGSADMSRCRINESLLAEAAFRPKTYAVTLDKGDFLAPYDAKFPEGLTEFTPRFRLRLTFDTSPYPPRDEWKRPEEGPDSIKFWEWRQFCGQVLEEQ